MSPAATPALIDILSLIQQHANIALVGKPTRHHKNGVEHHSDCPFCKVGKDRFAMWPQTGRYYCRVCGRYGDMIQFLKEYCDMSFREACSELDIDPRFPEEWKPVILPLSMTRDEPPNKIWMEAAEMFCWRAQKYLFSPGGERGLNYLHKRGFTNETIKRARLGFCPDWYNDSLDAWGLATNQTEEESLRIPEGIIIPWIVGNAIWKLSVRRPNKSYFQVTGSSDALYGIDDLLPDRPVFLFESEFDKLSADQEAGNIAAMIATGGASKGQTTPLRHKLKQASHRLIGFDNDVAGNEGAEYWLKMPNTLRWIPWGHDINEALQRQPTSVRLWAEMGIKAASIELQAPETVQAEQSPIATPALQTPSKSHRDAIQSTSYRLSKPLFSCKFCAVRQWIWYSCDPHAKKTGYETWDSCDEWVCFHCYSPAHWTQKFW
jgi:DNA primase